MSRASMTRWAFRVRTPDRVFITQSRKGAKKVLAGAAEVAPRFPSRRREGLGVGIRRG
jgi:hypothetical protein